MTKTCSFNIKVCLDYGCNTNDFSHYFPINNKPDDEITPYRERGPLEHQICPSPGTLEQRKSFLSTNKCKAVLHRFFKETDLLHTCWLSDVQQTILCPHWAQKWVCLWGVSCKEEQSAFCSAFLPKCKSRRGPSAGVRWRFSCCCWGKHKEGSKFLLANLHQQR